GQPAQGQRDEQPEHHRDSRQPDVVPEPGEDVGSVLVEVRDHPPASPEAGAAAALAARSADAWWSIRSTTCAAVTDPRSRPSSSTTTPRPDGDESPASRAARREPASVASVPPRCSISSVIGPAGAW